MSLPCPSCAAPLDDEGICTSCGALARGFFRGLDLGTPQLAAAVANGLDFYLLLGVTPTDDIRTIGRRYRQLRVLFPDDPAHLAPEPARRLALLELAGRALTDPRLRQAYDQLRAGEARIETQVVRCPGCGAPQSPAATRCPFCATPRPAAPAAGYSLGAAPPGSGPPAAEPVDYYAMLGLTASHLMPALIPPLATFQPAISTPFAALDRLGRAGGMPLAARGGPPTPDDIDAAALAREREVLLAPGYTQEERDERANAIEIARRILRDEQRRSRYDMLLLEFRQGLYAGGRLDALRHLQELARADMAESHGEQPSAGEGAALLKQGQGYLDARLPREAIDPLRRAVAALPRDPVAHRAYMRAILESDNPLALGGFALRQVLKSLDTLAELGAAGEQHAALAALCRGLLARDQGDPATAEAELQRAASLDARLAAAWRGLAALSFSRGAHEAGLGHCRRALALDPRDEHTLVMLIAACLRAGQPAQAREAAAHMAALRGAEWTPEAVLRELGG
jgi:tetratricopeptide (TPR) repeat protein